MKTSRVWNCVSINGKIMVAFALAAMIGSINVAPASGDDDHDRKGKHDNGRYEKKGRGHDRDRYEHRRRVYRSDVYVESGYAPPPVIYAPPPPPGISVFFPPIIFRP